jgi:glycosyltransferase involved in cell wall biosynthesis
VKVLYIATSFPEITKGSTIYTDLAEIIHEAGHEITVVVSEEPKSKRQTEIKKERGFDVLRIITGNYYDVGLVEKGITSLRIPILMRKGISRYLKNKSFDLILFESPPVTNASLVEWTKKKFNCPAYLMLKDIFPQNAVDIGIIKNKGILFKYFERKEKKLYKIADVIGCMSSANKDYVIKHNTWLDKRKVQIFPNTKRISDYINTKLFLIREQYGIPKDACVFLYGGNMGRPQYIELLCHAVKACKNERDIFFLFVGRGTDRHKLEKTIEGNEIKNALVIENLPRDDYEQIIKESDIGLIILDPRFTIPNYPSRILSYMEYAKPVLAATDNVSDIRNLIMEANFGEWVFSGDKNAFVDKVKQMVISKDLSIKGENGRKYIEDNFKAEYSLQILEDYFNQIERGNEHV